MSSAAKNAPKRDILSVVVPPALMKRLDAAKERDGDVTRSPIVRRLLVSALDERERQDAAQAGR